MTNGLLIIDAQNSFCLGNGELSVAGAERDVENIANFIRNNSRNLHSITCTLDTHRNNSIFFPEFWRDKDGNHPRPYTTITTQDIRDGKWTTAINPQWSLNYPEELEKKGRYSLTIWPQHCKAFTPGFCIVDKISEAIDEWEIANFRFANYYTKGTHIMTENYSVFQAEIPYPNAPETQIQQYILTALNKNDVLYICGEALSHCVKFTIDDINTYAPELAKKLVILEDCSSAIGTFDINTDPVYQKAVSLGVRIAKSIDIKF